MSVYFQFNIGQYIPPVQGRTKNMKIFVYVTLPLNPYRHFVLLAAKVHWTICLPLATSGSGLAFASLKVLSYHFQLPFRRLPRRPSGSSQ